MLTHKCQCFEAYVWRVQVMGEHLFVICGLHELIVHHNKGVYSLRSSLHQQTTPRQQLPFLLCDSLLLAASVGRIMKIIMRTTSRIFITWKWTTATKMKKKTSINSPEFPPQFKQDAQLSHRASGCVIVFAKNGRLELGDNILRTL